MGLRCLIVDDNRRFLAAARDLLERQGMRVVGVASNSSEAIERELELNPDVILVDIDLGSESGFTLLQRLAQDSGGSGTNVILISTHEEGDFAELIDASPAIGFVSKSELSAREITTLVGRARAADR